MVWKWENVKSDNNHVYFPYIKNLNPHDSFTFQYTNQLAMKTSEQNFIQKVASEEATSPLKILEIGNSKIFYSKKQKLKIFICSNLIL